MTKKKNPHIGSDFKDLLNEELKDPEFKREFEKARLRIAVGAMVRRIAKQKKLSVRILAKKMRSSPSQVQRLLEDRNISLDTLAKFAAATGKEITVNMR